MKKSQATRAPDPRRKPVKNVRTPAKQMSQKEADTIFSWGELDSFHENCESLFHIAAPTLQAIRSPEALKSIEDNGDLPEFTALAKSLEVDLTEYRNRLTFIRSEYEGRVATPENIIDEQMHGINVSEMYRQWMDSFDSVILNGTAADLSKIIIRAIGDKNV